MLLSVSDINFGDSLLVLVIGMLIIFAVLAVLVLTVLAYVKFFKMMDARKGVVEKKPSVVPQAPVQAVAQHSDDAELVAAITAAISLVLASESETGEVAPFRVKSIIRK